MLDVMGQAKNAIEAYNSALRVSLSNMANLETSGYKRLNVSFQSIFEKVLSQGTAAEDNMGGTNPRQYGQGVSISSVTLDFSAGTTTSAGPLNLAISGQGLFLVSPDGGKSFLYTRSGDFQLDGSGNLISSSGMQVYGLDESDNLVPITGLTSNIYTTNLLS